MPTDIDQILETAAGSTMTQFSVEEVLIRAEQRRKRRAQVLAVLATSVVVAVGFAVTSQMRSSQIVDASFDTTATSSQPAESVRPDEIQPPSTTTLLASTSSMASTSQPSSLETASPPAADILLKLGIKRAVIRQPDGSRLVWTPTGSMVYELGAKHDLITDGGLWAHVGSNSFSSLDDRRTDCSWTDGQLWAAKPVGDDLHLFVRLEAGDFLKIECLSGTKVSLSSLEGSGYSNVDRPNGVFTTSVGAHGGGIFLDGLLLTDADSVGTHRVSVDGERIAYSDHAQGVAWVSPKLVVRNSQGSVVGRWTFESEAILNVWPFPNHVVVELTDASTYIPSLPPDQTRHVVVDLSSNTVESIEGFSAVLWAG